VALSPNKEAAKVQESALFDLLRFVLAFAVLIYHLGVLPWVNAGNLAVQIFFALSGWLIGSILCNTRSYELNRFYFNRATRIWIPYFVTVGALYVAGLLHENVLPLSSRWHEFLIYDVTFTHNWFTLRPTAAIALSQMPLQGTGNHFWSIAVEEQFYLVAPVIVTLLPFGRKPAIWLVIAIVALMTRSWYASVSLGVLAATVVHAHPALHFRALTRALLVVAVLVTCAAMAVRPGDYPYLAPLLSLSVVLLCSTPLRRSGITRLIGGISFPLYLNAWIGIFAFNAVAKRLGLSDGWLYEALLTATAVGVSTMSYCFVDRIVMANRNRYFTPRLGWVLAAVAYFLVTAGTIFGLTR
jgi:peptidoglycan/LPS O-acetylase OafA/YrhL